LLCECISAFLIETNELFTGDNSLHCSVAHLIVLNIFGAFLTALTNYKNEKLQTTIVEHFATTGNGNGSGNAI
jgi:hypothetical protein